MQRHRHQNIRPPQQHRPGPRHMPRQRPGQLRPIRIFERQQQRLRALIIHQRRPRRGKAMRPRLTPLATPRASIGQGGATPLTDRLGNKMQPAKTRQTLRPLRRNPRLAGQAMRRQGGIQQDTPQPPKPLKPARNAHPHRERPHAPGQSPTTNTHASPPPPRNSGHKAADKNRCIPHQPECSDPPP